MWPRVALACCVVGVASFACLQLSHCAKLPSWRGPDTFFDGTLPSNRSLHGFASCDDGRIYVFGGDWQQGEMTTLKMLHYAALTNVANLIAALLRQALRTTFTSMIRFPLPGSISPAIPSASRRWPDQGTASHQWEANSLCMAVWAETVSTVRRR